MSKIKNELLNDLSQQELDEMYRKQYDDSLEYEEWGKSLDVGIDSAFARFGEYRPFNFNEFMEIVNKRDVKIIDHHQSHTN